MFKKIALSSAVAALSMVGIHAQAASTANVNVSLTVAAGCEMFVGTPSSTVGSAVLSFGSVTTYGSGLLSASTIEGATGTGTVGTANTIGVSCGDNGSGSALAPAVTLTSGTNDDSGTHYLSDGTNRLAYSVHNTAARNAAIDSGSAVTLTADATVTSGTGYTATLYGLVTTPSAVSIAGSYTDTLLLTLTY